MPKAAENKTKNAKGGKQKEERAPSAYNLFMKNELERLKGTHPELDHKQRFKMAAANWKTSKVGK